MKKFNDNLCSNNCYVKLSLIILIKTSINKADLIDLLYEVEHSCMPDGTHY